MNDLETILLVLPLVEPAVSITPPPGIPTLSGGTISVLLVLTLPLVMFVNSWDIEGVVLG